MHLAHWVICRGDGVIDDVRIMEENCKTLGSGSCKFLECAVEDTDLHTIGHMQTSKPSHVHLSVLKNYVTTLSRE